MSIKLGVNVDHIATIREARKGKEPDPVAAADGGGAQRARHAAQRVH